MFAYYSPGTQNVDYVAHWAYCRNHALPFVSIKKGSKKYATVSYDLLTTSTETQTSKVLSPNAREQLIQLVSKTKAYGSYYGGTWKVAKGSGEDIANQLYTLLTSPGALVDHIANDKLDAGYSLWELNYRK